MSWFTLVILALEAESSYCKFKVSQSTRARSLWHIPLVNAACWDLGAVGHRPDRVTFLRNPSILSILLSSRGQPYRVRMRSRLGLVILATDPPLLFQVPGNGGSMSSILIRSVFRIKHLALEGWRRCLKQMESLCQFGKYFLEMTQKFLKGWL